MRAIGNILRICSKDFVTRYEETDLKDAVVVLTKQFDSGAVKVGGFLSLKLMLVFFLTNRDFFSFFLFFTQTRWNAAHAACNLLQSPHVDITHVSWRDQLISRLTSATTTNKNFKVRINTALALCHVRSIEGYGGRHKAEDTLAALIRALDTVDNLEDSHFGEFRYKEQLETQV